MTCSHGFSTTVRLGMSSVSLIWSFDIDEFNLTPPLETFVAHNRNDTKLETELARNEFSIEEEKKK